MSLPVASSNRFDHIVIGAGIVGSATARSLAEAGRRVILLERYGRAHDRGSSHGTTRIFRQGYPAADYVELTSRALDGWRALERASRRPLLDATGAVDHGNDAQLATIEAAMTDAGAPVERLSAAAAARRFAGLRFEGDVLLNASGGRIRSADAIKMLLDAATDAGAVLRFGTTVTAIDEAADGSVVVAAGKELFAAESVVVAAGSWATGLVGERFAVAGAPLPRVTVMQVQPAHFPAVGGGVDAAWPSFVHYLDDGRSVYGLLTPGEGVKVGFHGNGVDLTSADSRDFTAEPGRVAELNEYVSRWVPGVDASRPTFISCLYDNTATEDFVLDRVGSVVVATGFSGHGFKFAPALGDILAGLAVDGTPAPERFRLARA